MNPLPTSPTLSFFLEIRVLNESEPGKLLAAGENPGRGIGVGGW